uniref:Putative thaumatin-like protein 1b n=1 Tax=Davidia involucrata TaxID=16924 RepID=A0A5B6YK31_DAVIN
MAKLCLLVSLITLTIPHLFIGGVVSSATFTMVNKCDHTVWPGILSNAGIAQLSTTGFALQKGESKTITAPSSWGGRFWGRTLCTEDSTGKFTCVTGDCGSGELDCAGRGAVPPATLAEFTLDGDSGLDFYDVSLVDGYNLPMLVIPQGGTGRNCSTTGCVVDLNGACPSELKVTSTDGKNVACKSACEAFGQPQYCCSGAYNTPATCKPSSYSQLFKSACPHAYSYAYDDGTSTFTCAGADYLITFCPSPSTSQKSASEQQNTTAGNLPQINSTMLYEGALDESSATTCAHMFRSQFIAGAVAIVVGIWRLCQTF